MATPIAMPPPVAAAIHAPRPAGTGAAPLVSLQDPQQPWQIPQTDLFVEVIGQVPIRTKLEDVSRLLAQRHKTGSINRTDVVKRLNKKLGDLKRYSERFD